MKIKKRMITIGIIMMGYLLLPNQVRAAALQANGGNPAVKGVGDWMVQIRQMQAAGGALGLTDTINYSETNYDAAKPETSDLKGSNTNLDIHMEKNTEYGALVLLSASSYGNPNPINDGETTTGNKTGVVMKLNSEWTATALDDVVWDRIANASGRYWDKYTSEVSSNDGVMGYGRWFVYKAKVGDAIAEGTVVLGNWHQPGAVHWFYSDYRAIGYGGLIRAVNGNVFSYYAKSSETRGDTHGIMNREANLWNGYATRAAVVVGSGI